METLTIRIDSKIKHKLKAYALKNKKTVTKTLTDFIKSII